MGDLSVAGYFTKIQSIADQLENLSPENKISDKNLVIYTINGLSSCFDSVAIMIRHRIPFPTFDETRSILTLEEQCLQLHRSYSPSAQKDHSSSPTLLHATG